MSWKNSAVLGGVGSKVSEYVAAGAISLGDDLAVVSTTGAIAMTLADGSEGDRLAVILKVDGGNLVLTLDLAGADNTLTFVDAGDCVDLLFAGGAWQIVGNIGAVAASTV